MLKVGDQAPDFSALLDDETVFRLSNWHGKKHIVLYFYPKDFTRGCTAEACGFRDNYEAIKEQDAILVGVSPDSIQSHRMFKEANGLSFPLASDTDQRVIRLYDVQRSLVIKRPKRVTYLIDRGGVVRGVFRHEVAIGRHQDDVLQTLRTLQAHQPDW